MNSHRILNHGHSKPFVVHRQFLFYTESSLRAFAISHRSKCNKKRLSQTPMGRTKTHTPGLLTAVLSDHSTGLSKDFHCSSGEADGLKKTTNMRSRRTRVNYTGLNEMILKNDFFMAFVWNIADALILYFLGVRNPFFLPLLLSVIYSNLVDETFVNRNETFIFFSLPDPSWVTDYDWIIVFSWQCNYLC